MKIKFKTWFVDNLLYISGIFLIISIFTPFINQYFGFIVKYDYYWLHIPYHDEFFRLVDNGLPLWSWNFFLGTNFWGSKSLSIVGDIFAWMTYFLNQRLDHLTMSMTYVMVFKFIVGYTGFYLLSKSFTQKPLIRLLMALTYVFSGWSTTFIEQTYFTSFYMLLPFMFYGVEMFLAKKSIFIYVFFTALVILSNFYFFWPAALLLLVYWIYRYLILYEFKFGKFFIKSMQMLALTLLSLSISAIVWLPGLIHLMSSSRLGNFLNEYSSWGQLNIASFFVFSFIPVLKYLDGFLKDAWYYFNQMGLYYGSFSILLIPQIVFIFKTKKEKIINFVLIILLYALMISPKIGFIFHFTYSLRYTFIITFMGMIVVTQMLDQLDRIHKKTLIVTELVILGGFYVLTNTLLPSIYPEGLPSNLLELELLKTVVLCTIAYTALLLIYHHKKITTPFCNQIVFSLIIFVGIFEIFTQGQAALKSQDTLQDQYQPPYVMSIDYDKSVEYIKSIDTGFYRVYQNNGYLSNINLLYDYKSISTYDSVFQYSISDFLDWARLYPQTNWEFRFNEPAFNQIMNVRYAIIDENIGENYMSDEWYAEELQRFGNYRILKFKAETGMAFTYNQFDRYQTIKDYIKNNEQYFLYEMGDLLYQTLYVEDHVKMDKLINYESQPEMERVYFNPRAYSQNWIAFDIDLSGNRLVFFSIPYDKGWYVTNQKGESVDFFEVQGGFIGIAMDAGVHQLEFKFTPQGFIDGKNVSFAGTIAFLILVFTMTGVKVIRRFKSAQTIA